MLTVVEVLCKLRLNKFFNDRVRFEALTDELHKDTLETFDLSEEQELNAHIASLPPQTAAEAIRELLRQLGKRKCGDESNEQLLQLRSKNKRYFNNRPAVPPLRNRTAHV